MNPSTHNMQYYNCNSKAMPHCYTRNQDCGARGAGVADARDGDAEEEHAGDVGRVGQFDSEDTLTRWTTTSHLHPVSPALVIPRRRGAISLERSQPDEDEHDIVTREYDMATWRMYFRILDHRATKSLSSSFNEPDRGGGPAGGVPIGLSLSEDEDSSWSMDTSDRSDSSTIVHARHYGGVANGSSTMRMMMMPRRPTHISIEEREEEEEEQQEEAMKALLIQFDDDEEDDGIFQFDV